MELAQETLNHFLNFGGLLSILVLVVACSFVLVFIARKGGVHKPRAMSLRIAIEISIISAVGFLAIYFIRPEAFPEIAELSWWLARALVMIVAWPIIWLFAAMLNKRMTDTKIDTFE